MVEHGRALAGGPEGSGTGLPLSDGVYCSPRLTPGEPKTSKNKNTFLELFFKSMLVS